MRPYIPAKIDKIDRNKATKSERRPTYTCTGVSSWLMDIIVSMLLVLPAIFILLGIASSEG